MCCCSIESTPGEFIYHVGMVSALGDEVKGVTPQVLKVMYRIGWEDGDVYRYDLLDEIRVEKLDLLGCREVRAIVYVDISFLWGHAYM